MKREGLFVVEYCDSIGRWHRPRVGTFEDAEDAQFYIESRTDFGRVKRLGKRAKDDKVVWIGLLVSRVENRVEE